MSLDFISSMTPSRIPALRNFCVLFMGPPPVSNLGFFVRISQWSSLTKVRHNEFTIGIDTLMHSVFHCFLHPSFLQQMTIFFSIVVFFVRSSCWIKIFMKKDEENIWASVSECLFTEFYPQYLVMFLFCLFVVQSLEVWQTGDRLEIRYL